jgi:hypothetical protein
MNLFRAPIVGFYCACVATVLAEAALLGVLWAKGGLTSDKAIQVMAVWQDVDLQAMRKKVEEAHRPVEVEQVSYEEVVNQRKVLSLDLDLREIALDKGLIDVRQLRSMLDSESEKYEKLKKTFDERVENLRSGETDESLQELQRQLETMSPRAGKEQFMMILEDPQFEPETALRIVVGLFKNMPLEKRKKLVAEFKTENEVARLHDVLTQIRLGVPDIELIRKMQKQLEQFDPTAGN